jgi:hypothetical protein
MEPTPLEHEVVAEATKDTGPEKVWLLVGVLTVTPANIAGEQTANRHTVSSTCLSMLNFSN